MSSFRTIHVSKETYDTITQCIELFKQENPSDNRIVSKNFMIYRTANYWLNRGNI